MPWRCASALHAFGIPVSLRTQMAGITREQIDRLENYVLDRVRRAQVGTGLGLPGRRHERGGAGSTEPGAPYRHGIAGRFSGTDGSAEPDTP